MADDAAPCTTWRTDPRRAHRPRDAATPDERAASSSSRPGTFGAERTRAEVAADAPLALPVVDAVRGFDALTAPVAAHIALKRLTSELVGRFAVAATDATCARYGVGPLRRYAADLDVPPAARAEVALLKAVALRYVMSDPQRLAMQARQRELLAELGHALLAGAPASLDPVLAQDWNNAPDDAAHLRVVVDQVALLTDQQAVARHAALARAMR
jgi:dGTPase